jgi:phosphoglucosamine mutase
VRLPKKMDVMSKKTVQEGITTVEEKLAGRGRVLLRPSGTEPLIRVMVEGEDAALVEKQARWLAEVVERSIHE